MIFKYTVFDNVVGTRRKGFASSSNSKDVDGGIVVCLAQFSFLKIAWLVLQIDADSDIEWSFADLLAHSVRTAKALEDLGLGPGDTVAFFSRNHHELFAGVIGTLLSGCTVAAMVPSNTVRKYSKGASLRRNFSVLHTKPSLTLSILKPRYYFPLRGGRCWQEVSGPRLAHIRAKRQHSEA